jgi:hypothetical protein
MTQQKRMTICESLTETHFGDGPPHWTLSAGKPWARPSTKLSDAVVQRDSVAQKLDWHGRDQGDNRFLALAQVLRSCARTRRCFSGACPICTRALQRWFVVRGMSFEERLQTEVGQRLTILSVVPDFDQVRPGCLLQFDWQSFRLKLRRKLERAGVQRFIAGVDVSLNHWDGNRQSAVFQFQFWGPFEKPPGRWHDQLKSAINHSGRVARPVMRISPSRRRASLAYGVKNTFKRRVSYIDEDYRNDRHPCRNTRDRPLKGKAWAELMIFLDRIGLEGRIIANGHLRR